MTGGAGAKKLGILLGKRGSVLLLDAQILWVVGEIGPFVGILFVVVKFFGSVVIVDVAVAFGAQGDIAGAEAGAGEMRPIGCGVFQERLQAVALVEGVRGDVC